MKPLPSPFRSRVRRLAGRTAMHAAPVATTTLLYRQAYGRWPSVRNPQLFSEHLMHRKLFDTDPRFPLLADKLAVRDYVKERVGDGYLAEVYTSAKSWSDLEKSRLPSDFVLKTTRAGVKIVRDFRCTERADLANWSATVLASRHGDIEGEWWYGDRPTRLFAEELLRCETGFPPVEHKLFVFDGRVQLIKSDALSAGERLMSLRDSEWKLVSGSYTNLRGQAYKPLQNPETRPRTAIEISDVAERLGRGLSFARIDTYDVDGRVIVGEITLCPSAGYVSFGNPAYDALLGAAWSNPKIAWSEMSSS